MRATQKSSLIPAPADLEALGYESRFSNLLPDLFADMSRHGWRTATQLKRSISRSKRVTLEALNAAERRKHVLRRPLSKKEHLWKISPAATTIPRHTRKPKNLREILAVIEPGFARTSMLWCDRLRQACTAISPRGALDVCSLMDACKLKRYQIADVVNLGVRLGVLDRSGRRLASGHKLPCVYSLSLRYKSLPMMDSIDVAPLHGQLNATQLRTLKEIDWRDAGVPTLHKWYRLTEFFSVIASGRRIVTSRELQAELGWGASLVWEIINLAKELNCTRVKRRFDLGVGGPNELELDWAELSSWPKLSSPDKMGLRLRREKYVKFIGERVSGVDRLEKHQRRQLDAVHWQSTKLENPRQWSGLRVLIAAIGRERAATYGEICKELAICRASLTRIIERGERIDYIRVKRGSGAAPSEFAVNWGKIPESAATNGKSQKPAADARETQTVPPVVLRGRKTPPIVMGIIQLTALTEAQYDVAEAALSAWPGRLTKDQLETQSKHGDARKIFTGMATNLSPEWKRAIYLPGAKKDGYGLIESW